MNLGLRKMQINSAAVPPSRIAAHQRFPRPQGSCARRGLRLRPAALGQQSLRHQLEADAARALDEHRVARLQMLGQQRCGRLRIGHPVNLSTGERLPHLRGQRTDGQQQLDAALARVGGDLAVQTAPRSEPSSSMSPSTATRRAGALAARSSSAARIDIGLAL